MKISPNVLIDTEWQHCSKIIEEKCTIVICSICIAKPTQLRVWKKRIVIVQDNKVELRLLEVVNIELSLWKTFYPVNGWCSFVLVFEGLAEECKEFKIVENLEPLTTLYNVKVKGSFHSDIVKRNRTDAYKVELKRA